MPQRIAGGYRRVQGVAGLAGWTAKASITGGTVPLVRTNAAPAGMATPPEIGDAGEPQKVTAGGGPLRTGAVAGAVTGAVAGGWRRLRARRDHQPAPGRHIRIPCLRLQSVIRILLGP